MVPHASAFPDYNFARGLTFNLHKQYIGDAIAAADSAVDFSQFDGVYIMASKNAAVPFSPTWVPNPGQGITVDGVEVRHVVTLGADARLAIPVYQWHVIHHETGHLMGLPDIYLFTAADVHAPAGAWTNMGLISLGAHYTAWEKRLLGWLRDAAGEFRCVSEPSAQVELSPLEGTTGIRGLAVQTGPTKAIVAEVRRPMGQDARLCDWGLLVYTVDSSIASGTGPLVVQRALTGSNSTSISKCGSPYAAPFDLENGKPSTFRDAATGVTFDIVGAAPNGGMTVRVTNPQAVRFFPAITAAIGAGAFGALSAVAPGGWMEIFGRNFGDISRTWETADFQGAAAPTSLDGITVKIAGRPAYISYISPGQINVQVPDGVTPGTAQVVVSNAGANTNSFNITVAQVVPGVLAPPAFAAGGRQYVVAQFADQSFVGPPGLIPGAAFRRAGAGDKLVLFGIAFGATSPAQPAGQIVSQANSLPALTVKVGNTPATVDFAGLVYGLVGLYQFNITVPPGETGDVALTISLAGQPLSQKLWLALQITPFGGACLMSLPRPACPGHSPYAAPLPRALHHRDADARWILRRVVHHVVSHHAFRFVVVPASGIEVALETRKTAAANLDAQPVPRQKHVARHQRFETSPCVPCRPPSTPPACRSHRDTACVESIRPGYTPSRPGTHPSP